MMDEPFLYVFIISRIKRATKQEIINKNFLKEQIGRILIRQGGLPRFMIKYIIEDLVKYRILTKLNKNNLYRLNKVKGEKQINLLY